MTQSSSAFTAEHHQPVPLWRDVRILRWLFQLGVLAVVVYGLLTLYNNLIVNLTAIGLNLSFDFLNRPASFDISEGPAFTSRDTVLEALRAGVINTLRVSAVGVVLATVLGTLVGIARLSRNWLTNRLALIYVEVFQNTPLLIQLFFWLSLILALPRLRRDEIASIPSGPIRIGALDIEPLAYFSQRGAALPGLELGDTFGQWLPFLAAALIGAGVVWGVRTYVARRRDLLPFGRAWQSVAAFILIAIIGWIIVPGVPVRLIIPTLEGDGAIVRYSGGWLLSNNFQAILLGLVLYTAAFIAETVRSGIQAIPFGQIEAATAQGFTRAQQLRLIILPQAMRVIIPPLINQYLNLVKNSSLAIAVGYPDLYNVSQTIGNKTGQNVQIVFLMMAIYLVMSLVISLILNVVNRRMQIVER
jgi:general L-amino acid transport system permease protein